MKFRLLILLLPFVYFAPGRSQILDNSMFRIYRAPFVLGCVTHLRFDKDSTYQIAITEIHCSLCDHEELRNSINSTGTWKQGNDTIFLKSNKDETIVLKVLTDSLLRPVFPMGIKLDLLSDSIKTKLANGRLINNGDEFYLIYDTYPNGVARTIIDKYRSRRNEYEIEIDANGTLKNLNYYWDEKRRKRLR